MESIKLKKIFAYVTVSSIIALVLNLFELNQLIKTILYILLFSIEFFLIEKIKWK